ncbi:TonB family protein [Actomonas aquatica]|uniref:TonB family protein n=1 Tax=Actomonas aquatica TaxID=2866162 RepID=A0ABZ1C7S5_9BACT|nr:TonB family protein [Opitutus sp. WL0086]WRQ87323.1 TonB family protein [Opitutus sp. WL0086]
MTPETGLLTRFAENGDADAFRQWVALHVDLVYSVALRCLNGDRHPAEEVAQRVFTTAATRAAQLARHPSVAGWLFTHTRYTAAKHVRAEQRRRRRETTAVMDPTLNPTPGPDWSQLRPEIDDALAALPRTERDAIILRYFEQADYATIGAQLKLSANAARMRVDRALTKLNTLLTQRGISSTAAALGTLLGAHAVSAAPAGLATTASAAALVTVATTAASSALTSASLFAMLKAPLIATAIVAATGSLLVVHQHQPRSVTTPAPTGTDRPPTRSSEPSASTPSPRHAAPSPQPTDADYAALEEEVTSLQARLATLDRAAVTRLQQPPLTGKIFNVDELDITPRPTRQATPDYPAALRKQGTEGRAVISMVIDAHGAVRDLETVSTTAEPFAEAALAAVSQWQFEPGRVAGAPVNSRLQVPVVFSLSPNSPPLHDWF